METKVKMDIPTLQIEEAYKIFTKENVLSLCVQSLRSVTDFKNVVEHQISEGKILQLAWRMDTNLDWIWMEDDVFGNPRKWMVLCGLALQRVSTIANFLSSPK
jgi:hypothetical protein